MAAFKRASNLMARFIDGRGDLSDRDSAIDLLEQAVESGVLPGDVQPSARADARRAIHLLRDVLDSAAGTPLADEVRGPLGVMELFVQAPDLDFSGPMFAQVESVLADAVRKMPESSRRDLAESLSAVLDEAGPEESVERGRNTSRPGVPTPNAHPTP